MAASDLARRDVRLHTIWQLPVRPKKSNSIILDRHGPLLDRVLRHDPGRHVGILLNKVLRRLQGVEHEERPRWNFGDGERRRRSAREAEFPRQLEVPLPVRWPLLQHVRLFSYRNTYRLGGGGGDDEDAADSAVVVLDAKDLLAGKTSAAAGTRPPRAAT